MAINLDERRLNIFTDGSCYKKPRRGGAGMLVVTVNDAGEEVFEDIVLVGVHSATNNEMELYACIEALKLAADRYERGKFSGVSVYTDSKYVQENYFHALRKWPQNRWMSLGGNPILHVDQWKELARYIKKFDGKARIEWVKGHSKSSHNKRVDRLAKQSAKGVLKPQKEVKAVRRKLSPNSTVPGSFLAQGQTVGVRIIETQYLRTQKIYRYRFEVISKRSKYFQCVDWTYSLLDLRAGHHYKVTFNKNEKASRILRIIEELNR